MAYETNRWHKTVSYTEHRHLTRIVGEIRKQVKSIGDTPEMASHTYELQQIREYATALLNFANELYFR